jgi:hypothetical protein
MSAAPSAVMFKPPLLIAGLAIATAGVACTDADERPLARVELGHSYTVVDDDGAPRVIDAIDVALVATDPDTVRYRLVTGGEDRELRYTFDLDRGELQIAIGTSAGDVLAVSGHAGDDLTIDASQLAALDPGSRAIARLATLFPGEFGPGVALRQLGLDRDRSLCLPDICYYVNLSTGTISLYGCTCCYSLWETTCYRN